MKSTIKEMMEIFRDILGEVSIEEIVSNKELMIRAELIRHLFVSLSE